MKKLITLLLVLTGCVMSASATKTIYVQNNCSWPQMRSWQWGGSTGAEQYMFIGSDVKVATITVDSETYYTVTLDDTHQTHFIIDKNYDSGNEKTVDLAISSVKDGSFYYLSYKEETSGTKYYTLTEKPVYTYNFSVDKADGVTLSNIYLWKDSGGSATELVGNYPGASFTGGDYTYRTYTDRGTINVQFNQGNSNPKTGDLTANQGNNKYYISTITIYGGQAVKTNTSGYATAVSTGNLDITSGIAYVAEDKGTWAKAHNVTGIMSGNPFLIKGTASTTYCFAYGSGADLPCTNAFKVGTGGNLASVTDGKYNYILNGDSFYAANDKLVHTNKAYLQLSAQVPATATSRVLRFDGEDETTGIEAVDVNPETVKEGAREYYNLNGQRVMNPSKGLYIVNGKKVIIK